MPRRSLAFAGCFAPAARAAGCRCVFVGLPCDSQSSYRRGAMQGPKAIRREYSGDCYNSTTESGVDLAASVADLGDVRPRKTWKATAHAIQAKAASLFSAAKVPFFAGGDHAVTIPAGRALAALDRPVHVVQFDAHPDLYPVYDGDTESHACVAARLLEMSHIAGVTQIGIRTMNAIQKETGEKFRGRLHTIYAREVEGLIPPLAHIPPGAPIYVTLDLDVFDPAYAPGVSHPVPGGLSPRQVLSFLQNARFNLVGMDVVELNPRWDQHGRTAVLAGRLLHEAMGLVASS